ncbi:MAG: hypothetical protein HYV40_02645 [Candidatus Levybacteria bacterium]|nr:hypothetical protein [Candidatus Levybacteria bacterium]
MSYLNKESSIFRSEHLLELNSPAEEVFRQAYRIVDSNTFTRIGAFGILYGISGDNEVSGLLEQMGASPDEIRFRICEEKGISILPEKPVGASIKITRGVLDDVLSGTGRDIVRVANSVAEKAKIGNIGPESLLIGLVFEGTSRASRLLKELGIGPTQLLQFGQPGNKFC